MQIESEGVATPTRGTQTWLKQTRHMRSGNYKIGFSNGNDEVMTWIIYESISFVVPCSTSYITYKRKIDSLMHVLCVDTGYNRRAKHGGREGEGGYSRS